MAESTISRKRSGRTTHRRTEPKLLVLRALAKYYCLRTRDLAYILKSDVPDENDIRALNFTLVRLRAEHLIRSVKIIQNAGNGNTYYPAVHGLTDKGVRLIGDGHSFEECRTAQHEIDLSALHIDLEDECEKNAWTLYWRRFDLKKKHVHPDVYFRLTRPEGSYHFFIERERQKPNRKTYHKLSQWYDYYNSDDCEKEWGFWQFRVIVVKNTKEVAVNLQETLAKTPIHLPACKWYRAAACTCSPTLMNHRMFWITTEDDVETNIGGKIFITPKYDTYSLADI